MTRALIIFMKNPDLGKVKTRLAATLGDLEALRIYHLLLAYTQSITQDLSADVVIYYTDFIEDSNSWNATSRHLQGVGDLGQKMAQAFEQQLAKYDQVCGIGTDCAQLTRQHLDDAFAHLDSSDFVLGPANDGGYYLIGMNNFTPEAFQNITWSTTAVLSQTIKQLDQQQLSHRLLPELIDVDTIEDWEKVLAKFSE